MALETQTNMHNTTTAYTPPMTNGFSNTIAENVKKHAMDGDRNLELNGVNAGKIMEQAKGYATSAYKFVRARPVIAVSTVCAAGALAYWLMKDDVVVNKRNEFRGSRRHLAH